jgi:hypothetical protein
MTATLCSKWADREPSPVTAVQPSLRMFTFLVPWFSPWVLWPSVMPSCRTGPVPLLPKLGTWGSSWRALPIRADELPDHVVARGLHHGLYGLRDVMEAVARPAARCPRTAPFRWCP